MAAKARDISTESVKRWFRTLSIREKSRLATELMEEVSENRAMRIQELEAELADLRGNGASNTPKRELRRVKKRHSPLAGVKVPPKYADKVGNTWTGRGIMPKWLREATKGGKKSEDFLIAKSRKK